MTDPARSPGLSEPDVERLFLQLERPLFNVVYRWLWDRDDAAEVVQDSFTRLWQARARVQLATASAYIFKIGLNLAVSRRRWRALRHFVALDDDRPADDARQPDFAVLGAERALVVRAALDTLPDKLRRVLVLCELSELPYAEIAATLSIPIGTVGSRRNAALAQLRRHLQQQDHRREPAPARR